MKNLSLSRIMANIVVILFLASVLHAQTLIEVVFAMQGEDFVNEIAVSPGASESEILAELATLTIMGGNMDGEICTTPFANIAANWAISTSPFNSKQATYNTPVAAPTGCTLASVIMVIPIQINDGSEGGGGVEDPPEDPDLVEFFKTEYAAILSKTVETVTLDDQTAVGSALASYYNFTASGRPEAEVVAAGLVAEKELLDALLEKITALKEEADAAEAAAVQQAVDQFKILHAEILAKTDYENPEFWLVDTEDRPAVNAALADYESLSISAKGLLYIEKQGLDALINMIVQKEEKRKKDTLDVDKFLSDYAGILSKSTANIAIDDKNLVTAAISDWELKLWPEARAMLQDKGIYYEDLYDLYYAISALEQEAAIQLAVETFRMEHADVLNNKTVGNVDIEDSEAVDSALGDYNLLPSEIKLRLQDEKALLNDLRNKISELEITKANQLAANAFKANHAAILAKTTEDIAIIDKENVTSAYIDYIVLWNAIQALIPDEGTLLENLLEKINELELLAGITQLNIEADNFRLIYAIVLAKTVGNVAIADKAAVNAALSAYESFDTDLKDILVSEKSLLDDLYGKIEELVAEAEYAEAVKAANQAEANNFRDNHLILLKTVGNISIMDKTDVNNALADYAVLGADVKTMLENEKSKLDALLAKIGELEDGVLNQIAADEFKTDYSAILGKTVATVAITDEDNVNAALTAYNALSAEVKALLANEKNLLDNLLAKIEELETSAIVSKSFAAGQGIHFLLNGAGLQIQGISKPETLRLFNLNGKVLMSKTVAPNEIISISHLPKGVYIANASGKTHKITR